MGLLDRFTNMDDDQSQGLLSAGLHMMAASGPSHRPTNFGMGALQALHGYQDTVQSAKKRRLMEQEAAQTSRLRGLQIQDAESDLENQATVRQRSSRLQDFYAKLGQGAQPQQPGMSTMNGPTVENAQLLQQAAQNQPSAEQIQDLYAQKIGIASQLRAAGFHPEADAEEEKALKFREEYSTDPKAMVGPDGKLGNYQLAKYGSAPRNLGLGVKPDMKEVRLGNRVEFVDANAVSNGKQFAISQSPDNAATVGASYANAAATRSIAEATRDAARITRDQQTEMKLGDDYRTQSKTFKEVSDAYRTINATLDKATLSPAATLAGATKFMKLLDPGSVVRESELGMALAATGVFDRATNYHQTLLRGKVLTPAQAADFKKITGEIYRAAQQSQQAIDQNYRKQAEAYGLRPDMVVQELGQNATPREKIPPGAANMLKLNPKLRDQFDAKYGAGSAASILGK